MRIIKLNESKKSKSVIDEMNDSQINEETIDEANRNTDYVPAVPIAKVLDGFNSDKRDKVPKEIISRLFSEYKNALLSPQGYGVPTNQDGDITWPKFNDLDGFILALNSGKMPEDAVAFLQNEAKDIYNDIKGGSAVYNENTIVQFKYIPKSFLNDGDLDMDGVSDAVPMSSLQGMSGKDIPTDGGFKLIDLRLEKEMPKTVDIGSILDDYYSSNLGSYMEAMMEPIDKDEYESLIKSGKSYEVTTNGNERNPAYFKYNDKESYQHANILFVGPPGAGKSAVIRDWLKNHEDTVGSIIMSGANLTKYIMNGLPKESSTQTIVTKENETGDIITSIEDVRDWTNLRSNVFDKLHDSTGKPTILFIDEINRTEMQGMSALLQLIQDKSVLDNSRGNGQRKYTTFLFTIAAMNDNDKGDPITNALADRFNFVYVGSSAESTYMYWLKKIKKRGAKSKEASIKGADLSGAFNEFARASSLREKIVETLLAADFNFNDDGTADIADKSAKKSPVHNMTMKDTRPLGYDPRNDIEAEPRTLSARGFGTAISRTSSLGNPTEEKRNSAQAEGAFVTEIRKWTTDSQFNRVCDALTPLYNIIKSAKSRGLDSNTTSSDDVIRAWSNVSDYYIGVLNSREANKNKDQDIDEY